MRRSVLILVVLLGSLLVFASARAESVSSSDDFYRSVIESRITRCQEKAKLVHARSENLQREGERALEQLRFLENRKEELVREMVQSNLGKDRRKAGIFLMKAYSNHKGTPIMVNR